MASRIRSSRGEARGRSTRPPAARRPVAKRVTRLLLVLVALASAIVFGYRWCVGVPGRSFTGPLPPFTERETALALTLCADVEALAGPRIGERNVFRPDRLEAAARWLEQQLAAAGLPARRQTFEASRVECSNLETEIAGAARPGEIVVIGAHYDSVRGCPGANDNGSGVAALLALARVFGSRGAESRPARTLRFVAFVNEEPPHFQTSSMGSVVYAKRCRERGEEVVAMLSLETMGWFSDEPGSQRFPPGIGAGFPSTGNFIGFVSDVGSRALMHRVLAAFRAAVPFPSEGAALPGFIPGVGWSDHWSFWRQGYRGVMVTDTAAFRFPHYHEPTDTPDKVDCRRLARVVVGLEAAIDDLTR